MHTTRLLLMALALITLPACGGPGTATPGPAEPVPGPTQPAPQVQQPYVMSGVVRDAAGQPLAGVEVWADNTVYFDMNVVGTTDAGGRYALDLPHNVGTWRAGAKISRPWNGQTFTFTVYPDDRSAFQATTGAVRDFVWRIQGEYDGGVLGHPVNVYFGGGELDWDSLELIFTPQGPLIDDSTAALFNRTLWGGKVTDVPVDTYSVSATHAPEGTRAAVDVRAERDSLNTPPPQQARAAKTHYGARMNLSVRGQ
ncbi:carboxypeptidase regulatory-like domain-containing protein [Deinococcus sp. HMF7620]|uniref:Carboxypeptidase regulatory-like domain-containing protein n=1 Tax=Deinococcus arboris TaxID=2682977 RepID=A0A7C9M7R4_9DEIO|nr:carboxypeptidase regulatory-like domain-containing protein [Deinococcus arboris]MVN86463.1 carboxypeptidase regulatory-like domain-containing protein [Deinococcus arboris]